MCREYVRRRNGATWRQMQRVPEGKPRSVLDLRTTPPADSGPSLSSPSSWDRRAAPPVENVGSENVHGSLAPDKGKGTEAERREHGILRGLVHPLGDRLAALGPWGRGAAADRARRSFRERSRDRLRVRRLD